MTRDELAHRAGVARDRLKAMEEGRLAVTGWECLALAAALGIHPDEIRSGEAVPVYPNSEGRPLLIERLFDAAGRPLREVTPEEHAAALRELGVESTPPTPKRSKPEPLGDLELVFDQTGDQGQPTTIDALTICGWCGERHRSLTCA
jgi:hypothetical protein